MQDILVNVLGIEAEAKAMVSEAQVLAMLLQSQAQAEAQELQAQARREAEEEARLLREQSQREIDEEQARILTAAPAPKPLAPESPGDLPGFEEAVTYVVDVVAGRRESSS